MKGGWRAEPIIADCIASDGYLSPVKEKGGQDLPKKSLKVQYRTEEGLATLRGVPEEKLTTGRAPLEGKCRALHYTGSLAGMKGQLSAKDRGSEWDSSTVTLSI